MISHNALRSAQIALGASIIALLLAACGGSSDGGSSDDYTAVPAKNLPGVTDLAKDKSTVPVGEWGVVKYVSTEDKATVLAIKITDVKAGKQGDLKGLMGAGDLSASTPYYVSYSWANIEGDARFSPSQSLATPDGSALSVPNSFEKCKIPEALDYAAALGDEQHGCQVLATESGPPNSVVFNSVRGGRDVSFALS
jgi:hypothetical protein